MDNTGSIWVAAQLNGDPCELTIKHGVTQNQHSTFDKMGRSRSLLPLNRRRWSTSSDLGIFGRM